MKALFDALRQSVELLAGDLDADFDFQHDAFTFELGKRRLGFRDVRADHAAAVVERLRGDADEFPCPALKSSPGVMSRGNTGILSVALACRERRKDQQRQEPARQTKQEF